MKLTNKFALPEPIVEAIRNDGYTKDGADLSVTELIAPVQQRYLMRKHWDDLEEDASDKIYSLLGKSVHSILEAANRTGIAERRLFITVHGLTVSGGMDLVNQDGKLTDYKVSTAWKFKQGKVPWEFEQQLNIYAEILRKNNESVTELEVVGILRDWSKLEAARSDDYPKSQVVTMKVPMWPAEKARAFIEERVLLHKEAREEKRIERCTPEERWARPDQWAVMSKGMKRAVRLYASEEEAANHASQNEAHFVEKRRGANGRCDHYCSVNKFCSQYQEMEKELTDAF